MDSLPPYVIHQILKRSSYQDRLLTLQHVCLDWQRWTPLDDLGTLSVSTFERLRMSPEQWRGAGVSSCQYFESSQKWLENLLDGVVPMVGKSVKRIRFDSIWPRVNDTPPLFCAPEGFKRWTLTKDMLQLISDHCKELEELILTEENFVYTLLEPDSYPLLVQFPNLRRLSVARVDTTFGPYLSQLSLKSLKISGESAPLITADPDALKSLQLAHPFPDHYRTQSTFFLSRNFPNLERHSEELLVELEQLSEGAQRRRLADYRQLPKFKRFRVRLGRENGVRTELSSISGYGLPKLQGDVNLQVRQPGDLALNARFFSQLRIIRIEGLLNLSDAKALFTQLPAVRRLTLACHWTSDEQEDEEPLIGQADCIDQQISIPKLKSLRLTLWEAAPKWFQSLLKSVLGSAHSLHSFHLKDFSDDGNGKYPKYILREIGLEQTRNHLRELKCRVGPVQTTADHLQPLLQAQWLKLSILTLHAARLDFDQKLVSSLVRSFPNLTRFIVVPPSGPLRPLLPGNNVDDLLCRFQHDSLTHLINGFGKLHQLRLFATSVIDQKLISAIVSHRYLTTVKLWNGTVENQALEPILTQIDEIKVINEGHRRRPLFIEVFTLSSSVLKLQLPVQSHNLSNNAVYLFANGRSYAIDEQSFFFP